MGLTLAKLIELRRMVPPIPPDAVRASLTDRFLIPPFSVLDARQGYWQKRKRIWLELGIQSELGRGEMANDRAESGSARINDAADGQRRYKDNGLLGFSEQARTHYKGANAGMQGTEELRIDEYRKSTRTNATPGGSLLPAATLKDGKTQRGDGRGRPIAGATFGTGGPDEQRREWRGRGKARTFGSGGPGDLAAGFKAKGPHPIPGGDTGKNSAYLFKTKDGYKSLKQIQEETGETPSLVEGLAIHTTADPYWVRDRETASLDGLTHGTTIHPYDGSSSPAGQSGTSIFDPVLCEIAYRWFCPAGGRVLDPFAGGSVRGIVAAHTGRTYAGVDLRPEQAEANYGQMEAICPDADLTWAVGDSADIATLLPGEYDLLFSCPPYADLERYSDDPRDLSTMDYPQFLKVYRQIIAASCAMLREDRFAVWVVGDVRDRATGLYRGFIGDTIEAFRAAGLELYNEAVLLTAVGSLPIRVGKQFSGYRKLGKTHQNVLIFAKGDPALAAQACGEVDVDDLEMPECAEGVIALCRQDVQGTIAEEYLMDGEVACLNLTRGESYLLCDVIRGQSYADGKPLPRAWVGTGDGWRRVEEDLTYLVGDMPYLNRAIFPDAKGPTDAPPVPKRLR